MKPVPAEFDFWKFMAERPETPSIRDESFNGICPIKEEHRAAMQTIAANDNYALVHNPQSKTLLCFDYETHRMGVGNMAPKAVCVGIAQSNYDSIIVSNGDGDAMEQAARETFCSDDYTIVNQYIAFDLAVMAANYPHLIPLIFQGLDNGRYHCIAIREKLLNLVTTGDLGFVELPNGAKQKIGYSGADLAKQYLGKDRTADKKDSDSWRTNFDVLDGIPSARFPADAIRYIMEDVEDPLAIYQLQEQRRAQVWHETGVDPFQTEAFRVRADFCLFLAGAWGISVDPNKYYETLNAIKAELAPEKLPLLYEYGILRAAEPPRAYANGAKNEDGTPKMTSGSPEKVNETKLRAYIVQLAADRERHNRACQGGMAQNAFASPLPEIRVDRTDPSDTHPDGQVSLKAEWFEEFAGFDPVLSQYLTRARLEKMFETELPRMCTKDERGNSTGIPSPIVHPRYDVLKETGRTSSYGENIVPSINIQNVDPRARPCYVPREGYILYSCDFGQMELGTLAEKCIQLFGFSVMADMINAGIDLHEYLGAQLAYKLSPEFAALCNNTGLTDAKSRHAFFATYKNYEGGAFYKHFRKFAKPTNLGYPGGLGAETFIAYAAATYDVTVDLATAKSFRDIWMATFPEMEMYFRWINESCIDHRNGPRINVNKKTGETRKQNLYAYITPFGLLRSGAVYCAAANGAGLQSPSAEGALTALCNVQRACYDVSQGSILCDDEYGPRNRVMGFIHDELLGEDRNDGGTHERVMEICELMKRSMRIITPNVNVTVQACLMWAWDKRAEPVFGPDKRLVPWTPPHTL